jgi:hypothetical protein
MVESTANSQCAWNILSEYPKNEARILEYLTTWTKSLGSIVWTVGSGCVARIQECSENTGLNPIQEQNLVLSENSGL